MTMFDDDGIGPFYDELIDCFGRPRPCLLRVFVCATEEGFEVMPGGVHSLDVMVDVSPFE